MPKNVSENHHRAKKIAIVGAGMAGLSCATHLQTLGFDVQLFEKSRGPSGRMSTRHGEGWTADHGAQYFTARDPRFIEQLDIWMQNAAASRWTPRLRIYQAGQWRESLSGEKRYVGTPEMNSPGKFLAKNLSIHCNQTISQIAHQQGHWSLSSQEAGHISTKFDGLVLAMPAPQTCALVNDVDADIARISAAADMKGCWTMMAHFPHHVGHNFDAAFVNDEIISWIACNNTKSGRAGQEQWTIHANPQWSQQCMELDNQEAATLMLDCLTKLGVDCRDASLTMHRWRYASGSLAMAPEYLLSATMPLAVCGDWLHGGRVEGAWLSGYKLASQLHAVWQPEIAIG